MDNLAMVEDFKTDSCVAILAAQPLFFPGRARAGLKTAGRSDLKLSDSAGVSRDTVIAAARDAYRRECGKNVAVLCSEAAWTNLALRDAGLPRLTGDEEKNSANTGGTDLSRLPDCVLSASREILAGGSRTAIIAAARDRFRAEHARGKSVICSEKAWVGCALRDAGLAPLSEAEIKAHALTLD